MANLFFNIGLYHYLILALALFLIGFLGAIVAKNVIKVLISLEIMICAVNINFIAFASFVDNISLNGFVFSLFTIAIEAIEVAIALAVFYLMFREKKTTDMNKYSDLRR